VEGLKLLDQLDVFEGAEKVARRVAVFEGDEMVVGMVQFGAEMVKRTTVYGMARFVVAVGKGTRVYDMVRFGVVEQEMLLGKMVCGMVRFADVGMLLVAIEVVDMELVAIGVYNAAVENLEDSVKVDYIVEQ